MRELLRVLHLTALTGFGLSLVVHLGALVGVAWPDDVMGLHLGVFVVGLPMVFVMQKIGANVPQKDIWRASLRHCPAWVSKALYGVGGYAIFNFVRFLLSPGKEEPAMKVMGFSGHWMVFYAIAAATLYSAAEGWAQDPERRCPQGHTVSVTARFCDTCGAPIQRA